MSDNGNVISLVTTKAAVAPPAESVDDLRAERDRLRALVLAMSDAVDAATDAAAKLTGEMTQEAYERGLHEGYEHGARTAEIDWRVNVAPIVASVVHRPPVALLEWRRWGQGGRERFGRPVKGDHGPWTPADIAALKQRWEQHAQEWQAAQASKGGDR